MTKIIFLDDDHGRWARFHTKVPFAIRAERADECIQLIKSSNIIDWLFLDHDLGGETYVDSSREDCGMEVVRYLCEEKRLRSIHNIIVHSHNSAAAAEMYNKLAEVGYNVKLVPFYGLIDAIELNKDQK